MSDSVQPHRRQPTRLLRPLDSPGKNTGVGCHFLLQCMNMKSESEVTHSGPTLHDPMDCSLPSSSVHGVLQVRVLEWDAIAFSPPSVLLVSNFLGKVPKSEQFKYASRLKERKYSAYSKKATCYNYPCIYWLSLTPHIVINKLYFKYGIINHSYKEVIMITFSCIVLSSLQKALKSIVSFLSLQMMP